MTIKLPRSINVGNKKDLKCPQLTLKTATSYIIFVGEIASCFKRM